MNDRPTRTEQIAESEFTVYTDSLTIADLGKFEGECRYVPHFWMGDESDILFDPDAPEDECPIYVYEVTDEDCARFPELADTETVRLWQRSDGFVVECHDFPASQAT